MTMNTAERIYVASTNDGETASRLAEELARRIEDDIASRDLPLGGALGSLRELSERYSMGRSVVREAVGLLERRGLGKMRPGPCGGFILSKPHPEMIGEELANYFRLTGITLRQLIDAREAVDLMAARLAASVKQADADLARLQAACGADDVSSQLSARLEVARLTAEPVLLLFVECLNKLSIDFGRADIPRVCRRQPHGVAICRALRAGDVDASVAAARRAHRELAAWLAQGQESPRPISVEASRLPTAAGTLSVTIARKLAAEIARSGSVGTRLGSEWDLCERFNVSRLTFRQAIRLLQDSGLVECRRGRGNGLIVRDRRAAGTIRLVLAYMIGEKMDPMSAGTILFQMNCFMPALAVNRADASERQQLEAALLRVQSCDPFDRYDLLGLVQCVSRLADSPIIDLFSRCLAAFEARFRPSLAERLPASAQASYFGLVRRLLDRLPVGDPSALESAKTESSALMLEMSRGRPI
jgi:DNA-binding FadR family transcriptional regulator